MNKKEIQSLPTTPVTVGRVLNFGELEKPTGTPVNYADLFGGILESQTGPSSPKRPSGTRFKEVSNAKKETAGTRSPGRSWISDIFSTEKRESGGEKAITTEDNLQSLLDIDDSYGNELNINSVTINTKRFHDYIKKIEDELTLEHKNALVDAFQNNQLFRDMISSLVLEHSHSSNTQQTIIELLRVEITQYQEKLKISSKENDRLLQRIDELRKSCQKLRTDANIEIDQLQGENGIYKLKLQEQLKLLWSIVAELRDDKTRLESEIEKTESTKQEEFTLSVKRDQIWSDFEAVREEERRNLITILETYVHVANELRVHRERSASEIETLKKKNESLQNTLSLSIDKLKIAKEKIKEFENLNVVTTLKLQVVLLLDSMRFMMPSVYGTCLTSAQITVLASEITDSSKAKQAAWTPFFAFFVVSVFFGSYRIFKLSYRFLKKLLLFIRKKILFF